MKFTSLFAGLAVAVNATMQQNLVSLNELAPPVNATAAAAFS